MLNGGWLVFLLLVVAPHGFGHPESPYSFPRSNSRLHAFGSAISPEKWPQMGKYPGNPSCGLAKVRTIPPERPCRSCWTQLGWILYTVILVVIFSWIYKLLSLRFPAPLLLPPPSVVLCTLPRGPKSSLSAQNATFSPSTRLVLPHARLS